MPLLGCAGGVVQSLMEKNLLLVAALAAACDATGPPDCQALGYGRAHDGFVGNGLPTTSPGPTPTPTLGAMVADTDGTFDFLRPAGWLKSVPLGTRSPAPADRPSISPTSRCSEEMRSERDSAPLPSTGPPCPSRSPRCRTASSSSCTCRTWQVRCQPAVKRSAWMSCQAGSRWPNRVAAQTCSWTKCSSRRCPSRPPVRCTPSIVACLRGPNLDDNERAVRALIESIKRR